MKAVRNIVLGILAALAIIPATIVIILQIPAIQTFAAKTAVNILSKDIDGEIGIGRVSIAPLHTFIFNDICIKDAKGDTIAAVGKLTANLSSRSVFSRERLIVHRIFIDGGKADIRHISPDQTNIGLIISQLAGDSEKESTASLPWERITVRKVKITDLDFAYRNSFAQSKESDGVDFNDLHIKNLNLKVNDISYSGIDDISATLSSLSFLEEKSGVELKELSCEAKLGKDGINVRNLHLDDGKTLLNAGCRIGFDTFDDFSSFTSKIPLDIHFARSFVDLASAMPFTEGLDGMNLKVWLSGDITGTLSDLNTDNLLVESESGKTIIRLTAELTGLPEVESTVANITIPSLTTTISEIDGIISSVSPSFKKGSVSKYDPGESLTLQGRLCGPLDNFTSSVTLAVEHCGSFTADMRCRGLISGNNSHIEGTIDGQSLAIGRFLKDTALGNASFKGAVAANLGDKFSVSTDEFTVSELYFHGYDYRGIKLSGAYCNDNIAVKIQDSDPNINLKAEALAKLGSGNRSSYLAADIDIIKADLAALKFDKREVCSIDGRIKTDIELKKNGTVLGKADISALRGHLKEGICNLGDIKVNASANDAKYKVKMDSKLVRATYEGTESMGELANDIKVILAREMGNILKVDKESIHQSEGSRGCKIALETGNLKPLTTFLLPDLHVGEGTKIQIDIDGSKSMEVGATVPMLAYGKNRLKNLTLTAGSAAGPIRTVINSDLISIGDFALRNNRIAAEIEDNSADISINFDNKEKEKRKGDFYAGISFPSKTDNSYTAVAEIESSHFEMEDCIFDIDTSRISYRDKLVAVDNLRITSSEGKYIAVDGLVSESVSDTLSVAFNKVDLSLLNNFLKSSIKLYGTVDGRASGVGLFGKKAGLLGDITASDMVVGKDKLGDIRMLCKWDENKERFNLLIDNNLNGRKPLNATGFYKPSDKSIGVNASIDHLAVSWLEPFLTGIVSEMSGTVSGDITMEGPLDKFKMSGSGTRFNDLACKVDFTQVPYVINGPFSIDEKGVSFQNDTISDLFGHHGVITGGVSYDRFDDIRFGVNFRLRDMHALNTTAADEGNGFYGKAFATGRVKISGPLDKILLGIDVRTGTGSVHIPLSSSGSDKNSILTFVDRSLESTVAEENLIQADERTHHSSLDVNVKLHVTNQTEVGLDINRSLGDMLKAHGNGNVEINVGEDLFDIKGGYNIEDGSYKLALMGITSKDFIINPGGTINFNGDIMQSDLGITATYRTKASIGTLIADSTSVNSRRTVNCGIGISGKLANPQLSFDIDIPDLDPTTQGLVQSALSTEEKRLKQILALLVSGSFVPDEQSGIVNNTTVLYSNASEIMANQINNIFRQLDIPLDLGFNYQPGSGGVDIFDVAISTQLFNNRVTINGNIGNQDYLTTSNTSEVVGNVDMEIKMNKSGKLRLNLFSHAADRYSNYLDQTQRNGAGIVYQEEFDTFKELCDKIFRKKSRGQRGGGRRPDEPQTRHDNDTIKK